MTLLDEQSPHLFRLPTGPASDLLRLAAALLTFAVLAVAISAVSDGAPKVSELPEWHGNVAASGAFTPR